MTSGSKHFSRCSPNLIQRLERQASSPHDPLQHALGAFAQGDGEPARGRLAALADLVSWSEARSALASLASLGEVTHLSDDELAVIVDAVTRLREHSSAAASR